MAWCFQHPIALIVLRILLGSLFTCRVTMGRQLLPKRRSKRQRALKDYKSINHLTKYRKVNYEMTYGMNTIPISSISNNNNKMIYAK